MEKKPADTCLMASFCWATMSTRVSRLQEGYTSLDFNDARDDGVAVASAGPYADHLHLDSDR